MHALVPGATAIDQIEPCATPTLHQLLTHTSGLSYAFNPGLLGAAMMEHKINFGSAAPHWPKRPCVWPRCHWPSGPARAGNTP